MPYEVREHRDEGFIEIKFTPPVDVEEYFKVREAHVHKPAAEGISRFVVDISEMVFTNLSQKDVIVEFAESWEMVPGQHIRIAFVMPDDFDSQNEIYMLTQLSRMNGLDIQPYFASEKEKAIQDSKTVKPTEN